MNQQFTAASRANTIAELNAWAGTMLEKLDQNPLEVFEREIGYTVSFDAYHTGVKSILTGWLNRSYASPFDPEIRKPLRWGEWELTLSVHPGRRSEYGYFGAFGGRPKRLMIHGTCLGGRTVHAVEWDTVDEIMTELLRSVAVTFDQAWFLFGTGWAPQGLYRGHVTAATLQTSVDAVHEDELATAPLM